MLCPGTGTLRHGSWKARTPKRFWARIGTMNQVAADVRRLHLGRRIFEPPNVGCYGVGSWKAAAQWPGLGGKRGVGYVLGLCCVAGLLAGCAIGPAYRRPAVNVPAASEIVIHAAPPASLSLNIPGLGTLPLHQVGIRSIARRPCCALRCADSGPLARCGCTCGRPAPSCGLRSGCG